MMIREFIRSILEKDKRNKITEVFPNSLYEEEDIWNGAMDLVEDVGINLTAEKDLKFFITNGEEVIGAAFTFCNENYFGFTIVTDPDFNDLKEELIIDCLDEYDIFLNKNPNLAIQLDDERLAKQLIENYGMKKIKNNENNQILLDSQ